MPINDKLLDELTSFPIPVTPAIPLVGAAPCNNLRFFVMFIVRKRSLGVHIQIRDLSVGGCAGFFANHAKKKNIDLDDVRLAVQMQLDKSFTSPPPREVLLELARVKNVNPLPLVKPHCGLRLPPDRYCLSSCNYRLKQATKKVVTKAAIPSAPTIKTVTTPKPPGQNVVVKRPTGAIVNVTSKPTSVPKPVLKFTSSSKVVAKPAVRVTAGPSSQGPVKMEVDEVSHKRKRDEDDYDM
ncbi:unnamed protein product [Danaus chrysippus]|uniref:(African queen) hypothetical protein n=1 Tax=Danaus chrysippus TaxID=151541 RepID=A0A8J2QKU7_9NEOP|nr:unnamed protein product [Danaus chrysippus]